MKTLGIFRGMSVTLAACAIVVVSARAAEEKPATPQSAPSDLPGYQAILDTPTDVWGEASLKQPDGPSYEFFKDLLPPLRYCDARFRHYPITLSAPGAQVKARFVSNGSGINLLARQPNWVGETGLPIFIHVGEDLAVYGDDLAKLDGPKYEQGYLPIVQLSYNYAGHTYHQEAFASVDPNLVRSGTVFVRFTVEGKQEPDALVGKAKIELQPGSEKIMRFRDGALSDAQGKVFLSCDPKQWHYSPGHAGLAALPSPGETLIVAINTIGTDAPVKVSAAEYEAQKKKCVDTWNRLLAEGLNIETNEAVVNNAWRASTIGNFMMLMDDQMRYSQGNAYAKLYIAEGGDATRTMAIYGFENTAKAVSKPLFVYTRKNLEYHQAGRKLQMLAQIYFLTRDADFVKSMRQISDEGRKPGWQTELDLLLNGREEKSGLFPPEKYAGDIEENVYSLNSNANGWRGLRDMGIVLDEIGEKELAAKVKASAEQFRKVIMAAVEKSVDRSVSPPFVPLALFGVEKPYVEIYNQRMGGYWNIMSKYVLMSGVFPVDSEYADALVHYPQQHGGLCMGMNRNAPAGDWWILPRGINDLYGMRYALALLERDEPDRALVSFYGKLAQGFTRDTFIGCEGSSIVPMYGNGRQMYLPPNSAANGNFLDQLRYILVQDYDTTDDGTPDTLRLAFATPRRWLSDGAQIKVERAPTAFGTVAMLIRSHLSKGEVTADLALPDSAPAKTFLRLRLPDGYKVASATAGGAALNVADGQTIDLTGLRGKTVVQAKVSK